MARGDLQEVQKPVVQGASPATSLTGEQKHCLTAVVTAGSADVVRYPLGNHANVNAIDTETSYPYLTSAEIEQRSKRDSHPPF